MTTHDEIKALRDRLEARRAERKTHAIATLNRDFPDLVIDESRLIVSSYENAIYRPDNMTYYEVDYCYDSATKRETDLAWAVNWNNENGYDYQLIETPGYVIVATDWTEHIVCTVFYCKSDGSRAKGKKYLRAVNKTNKGLYVTIGHQRYYKEA